MDCPNCSCKCERDEVHNGVAMIYGPYGCPNCGWSEDERYNQLTGEKKTEHGILDQFGNLHKTNGSAN